MEIIRRIIRSDPVGDAITTFTILFVEQNARQALRLARRGYFQDRGRIFAEGLSQKLQSDKRIQEAYLGGFGLGAR